jgi:toxin ParE1/3/4
MPHRLAPRARADLDEIWHYIAVESGNEAAADRTVDLFADRFLLLSEWPRLGRARSDLRRGLRTYPVGNYIIFYRVGRYGVVIQRVLHAHRDLLQLFQG